MDVYRDSDDAAGEPGGRTFHASREERRVRAAVAHGDSESLGIADDYVVAPISPGGVINVRLSRQVSGDAYQDVVMMRF